ncbi:unnamed protein product [Brachionus calyciflorus]|uniref:Uncharacterized protein n=1 Tax=Brachionus calyciflorus TaxID=104777 RepID=A0A813TZY1_9BILA|nr:unnamed protein product [Brachionus calyciflorus]
MKSNFDAIWIPIYMSDFGKRALARILTTKDLLAKLFDQAKRDDVSQLSYKLNQLEKRLNNLKSENENDKRLENILILLRTQADQTNRQENDLNGNKRDLQQKKFSKCKILSFTRPICLIYSIRFVLLERLVELFRERELSHPSRPHFCLLALAVD